MRVVVASRNPVKVEAVRAAYQRMGLPIADLEAVSVPSGVPDQPRSDAETRRGASGRVRAARERYPEGDHWAGIEGGIQDGEAGMAAFAWVEVLTSTVRGRSRSATFFLPEAVARLVRSGMELGDADDAVFGESNSKQKAGAVGLLTGGGVDRRELYEQAVVLALVALKNPDLY